MANNRRSQMTKVLFRTSLMELMETKSISKITIKEICDGADLNRSTFYLHYTDQYNLLEDAENEVIEKIVAYLKHIAENDLNSHEYIRAMLDYIKENSRTTKVLFSNTEMQAFKKVFTTKAMTQIQEFEEIEIPPEKEKYVFSYIMQGMFSLIGEWINADFDLSSNKISELIIQLYMASMSI